MVLNLSPLAAHLNESLCSLRFATKVRRSQRILGCVLWCLSDDVGQQHDPRHSKEAGPGLLVGNWFMHNHEFHILGYSYLSQGIATCFVTSCGDNGMCKAIHVYLFTPPVSHPRRARVEAVRIMLQN